MTVEAQLYPILRLQELLRAVCALPQRNLVYMSPVTIDMKNHPKSRSVRAGDAGHPEHVFMEMIPPLASSAKGR